MDRRGLLRGGLAAGVSLALPSRLLADPLTEHFDSVFARPQANTADQVRLIGIAQREVERAGARLLRRDVVAIADFAQASATPRFHLVNLEGGTVRSLYVAHGRGSDPEHSGWLHQFSNQPGSYATSRGAYLTADWYPGKYGTSLRLEGLDADNSYALDRAIVMHQAPYAAPSMINTYGKLGRSEGCFALAPSQFYGALQQLYGGHLIYADRLGQA